MARNTRTTKLVRAHMQRIQEQHTQNLAAKSCRISTRSPVISFMFNVSPPVSPAIRFQEDACVRKCVRVRDGVRAYVRALKKERGRARNCSECVCSGITVSFSAKVVVVFLQHIHHLLQIRVHLGARACAERFHQLMVRT
jgi:hypothetical protein